MKRFDAYEYVGVIVPGSVVVFVSVQLFPTLGPALTGSLSLGDFGLMLILSLVVGHLLQAFGNGYENIVWRIAGGMPTTWPAQEGKSLLAESQIKRLETRLKEDFDARLEDLGDGRGMARELFVRVRCHGSIDRIETFNRSYGLLRGIASAFLVSAILVLIASPALWKASLLCVLACGIATYRMVRFGQHYARELFAEYLNIGADQSSST